MTGRVQGVWYRAFVADTAGAAGVGGSATNQPDGTVLMELEGEEQAVYEVLEHVGAPARPWLASPTSGSTPSTRPDRAASRSVRRLSADRFRPEVEGLVEGAGRATASW